MPDTHQTISGPDADAAGEHERSVDSLIKYIEEQFTEIEKAKGNDRSAAILRFAEKAPPADAWASTGGGEDGTPMRRYISAGMCDYLAYRLWSTDWSSEIIEHERHRDLMEVPQHKGTKAILTFTGTARVRVSVRWPDGHTQSHEGFSSSTVVVTNTVDSDDIESAIRLAWDGCVSKARKRALGLFARVFGGFDERDPDGRIEAIRQRQRDDIARVRASEDEARRLREAGDAVAEKARTEAAAAQRSIYAVRDDAGRQIAGYPEPAMAAKRLIEEAQRAPTLAVVTALEAQNAPLIERMRAEALDEAATIALAFKERLAQIEDEEVFGSAAPAVGVEDAEHIPAAGAAAPAPEAGAAVPPADTVPSSGGEPGVAPPAAGGLPPEGVASAAAPDTPVPLEPRAKVKPAAKPAKPGLAAAAKPGKGKGKGKGAAAPLDDAGKIAAVLSDLRWPRDPVDPNDPELAGYEIPDPLAEGAEMKDKAAYGRLVHAALLRAQNETQVVWLLQAHDAHLTALPDRTRAYLLSEVRKRLDVLSLL